MFNIGAGEMILIALVLLIAVGPEQLPGVIRRTGRVVGQLKTMSDNLRRDFNSSLDEIERAADVKSWAGSELEETVETIKEAATEPFKTDFTIDGSTKVTDIWARPPVENPDDAAADDSAADDSEQGPDETADSPDSAEIVADDVVDADDVVVADDVVDADVADEHLGPDAAADSGGGSDATDEVA
ncbi:MAG: hypothetical protein OEZ14_02645 [Acidimicrobiia bacterium]|nr:hypothetical protein [Acidimicrobiia bacterium]MDH5519411.1 hypothetical protein [Acidimicrobiia bacterium]